MKVIEIELMLSRAEASALRAVLDEYVKAIQYLENNHRKTFQSISVGKRRHYHSLDGRGKRAPTDAAVIDGMGELLRRGQDPTWAGPAFTLAAAATEH